MLSAHLRKTAGSRDGVDGAGSATFFSTSMPGCGGAASVMTMFVGSGISWSLYTIAIHFTGGHFGGLQMTAIRVVRSTRPFSGNHRRTHRMLRRAFFSKSRAIVRFLNPFQYLPANARRRLLRVNLFDVKNALRVVVFELPAQFVPALWNRAHAAPFPVAYLEGL